MQKINLLKKDYEHYLFPIPINCLFGRKRNRFISSELEQRHPCYSDNFGFDSVLCLNKKKFMADVVVIDKLKLSEYRKKNTPWIPGFFVEETKRPRFPSDRIKGMEMGAMALVLGVTAACLSFCFHKNSSGLAAEDEVISVLQISDSLTSETSVQEPDNLVKDFFCEITDNQGELLNFNWKLDGYMEKMSAAIKGVFPEKLEHLGTKQKLSTVIYENGIPRFELSVTCEKRKNQCEGTKAALENVSAGEFIREILQSHNCVIIEENYSPYQVKFIPDQSFSVLRSIEEKSDSRLPGISLVGISPYREKNYLIELEFRNDLDFSDGFSTCVLADYASVFQPDKKERTGKKEDAGLFIGAKGTGKDEKAGQGLKKIGEVKHENGTRSVFYKNLQGKMIVIQEG